MQKDFGAKMSQKLVQNYAEIRHFWSFVNYSFPKR